ncbi:MAG: hypothetical protein HXS54_13770 [Theionarchaea archaeon]|nr:hypothetical protein [Theionarchaea archaeon]
MNNSNRVKPLVTALAAPLVFLLFRTAQTRIGEICEFDGWGAVTDEVNNRTNTVEAKNLGQFLDIVIENSGHRFENDAVTTFCPVYAAGEKSKIQNKEQISKLIKPEARRNCHTDKTGQNSKETSCRYVSYAS